MINHTVQTLDREIPRRVAATEKNVRDLKNRQFIGNDSLEVLQSTIGLFTTTLAPGEYHFYIIQFTGTAHVLYDSELEVSTFINTDSNFAFRWPDGGSLTTDLVSFIRAVTCDLSMSNEVGAGIKTYVIEIFNGGTASKTIYTRYGLNVPKGALA